MTFSCLPRWKRSISMRGKPHREQKRLRPELAAILGIQRRNFSRRFPSTILIFKVIIWGPNLILLSISPSSIVSLVSRHKRNWILLSVSPSLCGCEANGKNCSQLDFIADELCVPKQSLRVYSNSTSFLVITAFMVLLFRCEKTSISPLSLLA